MLVCFGAFGFWTLACGLVALLLGFFGGLAVFDRALVELPAVYFFSVLLVSEPHWFLNHLGFGIGVLSLCFLLLHLFVVFF